VATDVRIPTLGESVNEGVIVRWLKDDGALVRADEPLLELETEKATMEIAAQASGRLRITQPVGARVEVGAVVGRIEEAPAASAADGGSAAPAARGGAPADRGATPADRGEPSRQRAAASPAPAPPPVAPPASRVAPPPESRREVREPAAASAPAERGKPAEPARPTSEAPPPAPSPGEAARSPERPAAAATTAPAAPAPPRPATTDGGNGAGRAGEADVERVPMSELRRAIARRLVDAQRTAAILTTFNEIDCTELLALRKRHRERFRAKHGVDLGLMSLFSRAVVIALRDVRVVNARIDGNDIVYHRRVHLGIAVSTPRGLVVPVVRDADAMSLADLERAIGAVAARARDGKLAPDDLSGGTFTITNGGVFGSLLSTPLLNPPQSGILGMHKIEERPVAVAGQVVIRPMMYVALSYDHRLVDGQQAVTFLVRVKEQLEDPARMVLEV
jgi:2-oxoglutarate dehydrogenase E2 component (dihydrolipoamide succinyltransferase)